MPMLAMTEGREIEEKRGLLIFFASCPRDTTGPHRCAEMTANSHHGLIEEGQRRNPMTNFTFLLFVDNKNREGKR
jgi:hypothetical protein